MDVELAPIMWLKPHEEVKPRNVDTLHEMTLRWSAYTKPLLVDRETGTILDGHHRYQVGFTFSQMNKYTHTIPAASPFLHHGLSPI